MVVEFASLPKLLHLNAMEKCLLLEALMRHGKKELAEAVKRHIQDQGKVFSTSLKKDSNRVNKVFDIVLSLNALKSSLERDDLDRFMADGLESREEGRAYGNSPMRSSRQGLG